MSFWDWGSHLDGTLHRKPTLKASECHKMCWRGLRARSSWPVLCCFFPSSSKCGQAPTGLCEASCCGFTPRLWWICGLSSPSRTAAWSCYRQESLCWIHMASLLLVSLEQHNRPKVGWYVCCCGMTGSTMAPCPMCRGSCSRTLSSPSWLGHLCGIVGVSSGCPKVPLSSKEGTGRLGLQNLPWDIMSVAWVWSWWRYEADPGFMLLSPSG